MQLLSKQIAIGRWRSHRRRIGAALATIACLSCRGDSATAPKKPVAAIAVSGAPTDRVIVTGQTLQFTALASDSSGAVISGMPITWGSSAPAIATVSASGLVTGAAVGSVIITASAGGVAIGTDLSVRVAVPTPPTGATLPTITSTLGGAVTLTVPPAAVPAGTILNVAPAAASSVPASASLLANTAFAFGPAGTTFATPITIAVKFDSTAVTATERLGLALYLANNGTWEEVPNSAVTVATSVVSAPISHFSSYAVLRRPTPTSAAASAGNNQSGVTSAAVGVRPAVSVFDAQGMPLASVQVTFSVTSGGGTVTGATQSTGATGVAAVGSWTLGPNAGANTLTATVAGLVGSAIIFTATASNTAVGPATKLVVATAPGYGAVGGGAFSTQPSVTVTDAAGGVVSGNNGTVVTMSASAGATVVGTATATTVNGTATFSNVGITGVAGTTYTLTFSANGLASALQSLAAKAGVATKLQLATVAGGAANGAAFNTQPVVAVSDAVGNTVTGDNSTVVSLTAPAGASITGSTSAIAVNGLASFIGSGLTGTNSTSYTLTFAATGLTSVTQPIVAGAPDITVTISTPSPALTVKQAQQLTAIAKDGNTVVGGAVTWTSSSPDVATVSSTGLVTALKIGTTTISATIVGRIGTALVTVPAYLIAAVTGAGWNQCVITTARSAYCWGENTPGVGLNGSVHLQTPTAVLGAIPFASLSLGTGHVCGVSTSGSAYCWGGTPTLVVSAQSFSSVSTLDGQSGACALTTAGAAYCWGANNYGQLGSTGPTTTTPVAVDGGLTFKDMAAGALHVCGLTIAGAAYCWGSNQFGQLGTGVAIDAGFSAPVAVTGGLTFVSLTASIYHTCGLTSGGQAYCWGRNTYGQLGDSTLTTQPSPVAVMQPGIVFKTLSTGENHTCGVAATGVAYCWGMSIDGDLGDATSSTHRTPLPVQSLQIWESISARMTNATCAVNTAGVAYCWGRPGYNPPASPTPVPIVTP